MTAVRRGGLLALLVLALVFPLVFSNGTVTSIAFFALMFAAAATGWNIFAGYTGYIALGHAAFFGLGAYALALMCQDWNIPGGYLPFLLLPLVGVIVAICAVPIGWIALRTRRHTFVVITIAIFFIMQLMAYNLTNITNGSAGIGLPLPPWTGAFYNVPFYYVTLAVLLLAIGVSWWVRHSKYGLGLLAIRDDEDRARGLGVRTGAFKLSAFVISAFFVGITGALYAYFLESISPPFAFDALYDVAIALMAFFGGLGTLAGPIVGALILEPIQQYLALQQDTAGGLYLVLYGALFLIVILVLPEGIVPSLARWWAAWTATRGWRPGPELATGAIDHEESLRAQERQRVQS
ncbi:MAG TPA: branched-chain amino acid ABC transporter permease [Chloroflexota bacterium]|nr:branched-chain amino acid ABC transporter permease [Chloroflexota bacterium]